MKKFNIKKGRLTTVLFALVVPFGIFIIFLMFWKKIKLILSQLSSGTLDFGNSTSSDAINKAAAATSQQMQVDAPKKLGITITSYHKQIAEQCFTLINRVDSIFQALGASNNTMGDADEQALAQIIGKLAYSSDMAAVYIAYGTRMAKNRQAKILGFIWDDTTGNMRQHVERYMDDTQKIFVKNTMTAKQYILECIRAADAGYLSKI